MQSPSATHQRRARDYTRTFKACDSCRRKKTRCILDGPSAARGTTCQRCARERKECSLTLSSQASATSPSSPPGRLAPSSNGDGTASGHGAHAQVELVAEDTPWTFSHEAARKADGLPVTPSVGDRHSQSERRQSYAGEFADVGYDSSMLPDYQPKAAQQAVLQAPITNDGEAMKVLLESSRRREHAELGHAQAYTQPLVPPPLPPPPTASARFVFSELTPASRETIKLWSSFRFVRMGWLNAREAITYIDLQNLAPLSPVLDNYYRHHENHYNLITQEPLLCCTIVMISSRFNILRGTSSWSRSVALHDRLWKHAQHLVTRIIFGQENKSKAESRTLGTIQALLLMTEWAPRAIYFPPKDDGYDTDLLFAPPEERGSTPPGADDVDVDLLNNAQELHGDWFRDVILPSRMLDRMSWMLLGCAITLGHELGLFDVAKARAAKSRAAYQYNRIYKIIYTVDEQFSSRLGCTSQIPAYLHIHLPTAEPPRGPPHHGRDLIDALLSLSRLAKNITGTVFGSTVITRDLIQSYKYVDVIGNQMKQLTGWQRTYLDVQDFPEHVQNMVTVEFQYHRIFLHSLGMQAVVDRAMASGPSADRADPGWIHGFITSADAEFILQVIDGSCKIIQCAVRLAEMGSLRYCPARITMRVIAASVFMLKALGLGVDRASVEASLQCLQQGIEALDSSTWDDLDLASRYAVLLRAHIDGYKRGLVGPEKNMGAGTGDGEGWASANGQTQPGDDVRAWPNMPVDMSMAPFGVSIDESMGIVGLDDGDWSFLWNLPETS